MLLVPSCLTCLIHWSQVLSQEWRCSWSSANYIWVINNFIAYYSAPPIRSLVVLPNPPGDHELIWSTETFLWHPGNSSSFLFQLSFYDQFKQLLMNTGHFEDNVITHFSASFMACCCCCLHMPGLARWLTPGRSTCRFYIYIYFYCFVLWFTFTSVLLSSSSILITKLAVFPAHLQLLGIFCCTLYASFFSLSQGILEDVFLGFHFSVAVSALGVLFASIFEVVFYW